MANIIFPPINKLKEESIFGKEHNILKDYLASCAISAEKFYHEKNRIWEKNIPLWIARFFPNKYGPHKMDGNFSLKDGSVSHYSTNKNVIKFLKLAGKSKFTNHADFTLFSNNEKIPVFVFEVKSLLNNKKIIYNSLYKDTIVTAAHQARLGRNGNAYFILFNKSRGVKSEIERDIIEKKLKKIHIKNLKKQFGKKYDKKNETKYIEEYVKFLKEHMITIY